MTQYLTNLMTLLLLMRRTRLEEWMQRSGRMASLVKMSFSPRCVLRIRERGRERERGRNGRREKARERELRTPNMNFCYAYVPSLSLSLSLSLAQYLSLYRLLSNDEPGMLLEPACIDPAQWRWFETLNWFRMAAITHGVYCRAVSPL